MLTVAPQSPKETHMWKLSLTPSGLSSRMLCFTTSKQSKFRCVAHGFTAGNGALGFKLKSPLSRVFPYTLGLSWLRLQGSEVVSLNEAWGSPYVHQTEGIEFLLLHLTSFSGNTSLMVSLLCSRFLDLNRSWVALKMFRTLHVGYGWEHGPLQKSFLLLLHVLRSASRFPLFHVQQKLSRVQMLGHVCVWFWCPKMVDTGWQ